MGALWNFDLNPLFEKHDLKVYFETGTGQAESLRHALKSPFEQLYTVDIDKEFTDKVKDLDERLTAINDLSTNALVEYLPKINNAAPVLWFLDAHFPGADFHKVTYEESISTHRENSMPLKQEIEILQSRDLSRDVVIIDDFLLYDEDLVCQFSRDGNKFNQRDLAKSLGIELNSQFLYDVFEKTHRIEINQNHQGYFVATPL